MTKGKLWPEPEIEFLKSNYATIYIADIATALNKTEPAIKVKAHKLGLKGR